MSQRNVKVVLNGVQQDVEAEKKGDYFEGLNDIWQVFSRTTKETKDAGNWLCYQEGRDNVLESVQIETEADFC